MYFISFQALFQTDPSEETSFYAGRPVYVHSQRKEFLFYVPGRARGLWMVGPRVGRFSGGLANRGDDVCVDEVERKWKFADVDGWVTDPDLAVKCVNQTVGESRDRKENPGRGLRKRGPAMLFVLNGRKFCISSLLLPTRRPAARKEQIGGGGGKEPRWWW